jgi:serine palmitoyltransferase
LVRAFHHHGERRSAAHRRLWDDMSCSDQGVSHAIQVGALLSRSKVSYFKHNDVKDLRRVLEEIKQDDAAKKKKVYRKFVIIEGLYYNYGDIAPLPEILKLKDEFHFHLVMDDSLGIGTLGANGRGSCEHWGVPTNKVPGPGPLPSIPHQIASVRN